MWSDIKQDLDALQEITVEENGKKLAVRAECRGVCGKVFKADVVAILQVVRELSHDACQAFKERNAVPREKTKSYSAEITILFFGNC